MKTNLFFGRSLFPVLAGIACWVFVSAGISHAAVANVRIIDFAFSPSQTAINPGDQVTWTWAGSVQHSTTSDTGIWDSGIQSHGFVFTQTFNAAGNFSYHCQVHPFMTSAI